MGSIELTWLCGAHLHLFCATLALTEGPHCRLLRWGVVLLQSVLSSTLEVIIVACIPQRSKLGEGKASENKSAPHPALWRFMDDCLMALAVVEEKRVSPCLVVTREDEHLQDRLTQASSHFTSHGGPSSAIGRGRSIRVA